MKRLLSLIILFSSTIITAQVEAPAASPAAKIEQTVGLTQVSIDYSRPGKKGRELFGDLVPYGKVWRTGANKNTTISFSDDVKIGGKDLKKGTYGLYTIPNQNSWEVIFYSEADNWGVPQDWDESKIALKAKAEVKKLPFDVETFTIFLNNLKHDSADLVFAWGKTEAVLPINFPTDEKTVANIERVMSGPTANDYFAAASYYHETGKDLEKAYEWVKKATEMAGDQAFWMLRRKSLIEADMGKKDEAIKTAKRSLASAEKANNADYVKMNKESIAKWEGGK